jgi:hypothetical protein
VYDDSGHAGALILSRQKWNAIEESGDTVAGTGDHVTVQLAVIEAEEGIAPENPSRSIARGKGDD